MNTRTSIKKSIAVCLLGMLAAPVATAAVDPEVLDFVKAKTEIKKIDIRGHEVKDQDRIKNASIKGRWINNSAKFTAYAQIKRDDTNNRILCSQELTYNKKVIFEGDFKTEPQLVHIKADENEKIIEAEEVETIDEAAGGVYVLFTPNIIYVLNYEAVDAATGKPKPVFRKYENRK